MSTTTTRKPKSTKKFKALVAYLGSEEKAITAWNKANPESPIGDASTVSAGVQQLLDAGFTLAEAKEFAAETDAAPAKDEPLTSKENGDVLTAQAGLVPVRGRVYGDGDLLEAGARVLKTGKPEVLRNSGETRTKGVLVYRTDDGKNFAIQNLGEPS